MNKIGEGSYGTVYKDKNRAVKQFKNTRTLIHEYAALLYLQDCEYIVKVEDIDIGNKTLSMELYDCNLRQWLTRNPYPRAEDVVCIAKSILRGLIELHDRGLCHGDLKPGNVLLRLNPFKVVLGDCGFVSISKYVKVDSTAPLYKDIKAENDISHDIYSFAIIFTELLAGPLNIKSTKEIPKNYKEIAALIDKRVSSPKAKELLIQSVNENKALRPTARQLYTELSGETITPWVAPDYKLRSYYNGTYNISKETRRDIKNNLSNLCKAKGINRSKKAYMALVHYLKANMIDPYYYTLYIAIFIFIISAMFSRLHLSLTDITRSTNDEYSIEDVQDALTNVITDPVTVSILLSPSKPKSS